MEKQYFTIINEEQKGPFSIEELKALGVGEESMIWVEGFDDWKKASEVDSLQIVFNRTTPPPFRSKESNIPSTTSVQRSGFFSKNLVVIAVLLGVSLVVFFAFFGIGKTDKVSEDIPRDTQSEAIEQTVSVEADQENVETEVEAPRSTVQPRTRQLSEEEIRQNLFLKESSNPTYYLSASGSYRVNLAANTVINGNVTNSAAIAGFKNIKIKARFYSKTDLLIGEESFVLMEFVDPNKSIKFTHKISGWWSDIDHWSLDVTGAEGY